MDGDVDGALDEAEKNLTLDYGQAKLVHKSQLSEYNMV